MLVNNVAARPGILPIGPPMSGSSTDVYSRLRRDRARYLFEHKMSLAEATCRAVVDVLKAPVDATLALFMLPAVVESATASSLTLSLLSDAAGEVPITGGAGATLLRMQPSDEVVVVSLPGSIDQPLPPSGKIRIRVARFEVVRSYAVAVSEPMRGRVV